MLLIWKQALKLLKSLISAESNVIDAWLMDKNIIISHELVNLDQENPVRVRFIFIINAKSFSFEFNRFSSERLYPLFLISVKPIFHCHLVCAETTQNSLSNQSRDTNPRGGYITRNLSSNRRYLPRNNIHCQYLLSQYSFPESISL